MFLKKGHNHSICFDDALERATNLCAKKGVRFTKIRKKVLELIWKGHKPIGAYELLNLLKSEKLGDAPPTIYRALNFLCEHGLVHRIESLNAYVGCSVSDTSHVCQFFICKACGLSAEIINNSVDNAINSFAEIADFKIDKKVIEIEGLCPNCRS